MTSLFNVNLPTALEPYRQAIAATLQPFVKIKIQPNSTNWRQSKVGGFPYLPQGVNYPTNQAGEYLTFLAQLNFTEIPTLSNFPSQGILQFYIDGKNGLYGLDFDNPLNQDGFRVIYFSDFEIPSEQLVKNFDFLDKEESLYSPLRGEFSLDFTLSQSPITVMDFQFEKSFPNFTDELIEIYEKWWIQHFSSQGRLHQLGGYPYFTQGDPRFNSKYQDYILLLQIDSEYGNESWKSHDICWGDVGIGNFFIHSSKLLSLDFSEVMYNWDCT